MRLKPLALCEGEHDKCLIENVLRLKFKIADIIVARNIREIYKSSRRRKGEFMIYITGGKPQVYRALTTLSSQLLRNRLSEAFCTIIDENLEKPMNVIENRLKVYFTSKFLKERPKVNKDEKGFILNYRGFDLRIWVVIIPESLEKQVKSILRKANVDYCNLDYLRLFGNKSWFKRIIEVLNFIIHNHI